MSAPWERDWSNTAKEKAPWERDWGLEAAPTPTPETTLGGQAKEFAKGIPSGAIGLLQSAATGASAMLPEDYEKAAREKIEEYGSAAKAPFAPDAGYADTIPRKFGEALGSTLPFFALGPAGVAGRAGALGLGVGAGAGEARVRAEQEGGMEQRGTATAFGAATGATEVMPVFAFLNRLKATDPKMAMGLLDYVKRAFVTGGQEGAQEAAAALAQNLIAKGLYKPEQALVEGVGEEAAYGAGVGALIQGITDMALGGRRVKGTTTAQTEVDPEAFQSAAVDYAQQDEMYPGDKETGAAKYGEQILADKKAQLRPEVDPELAQELSSLRDHYDVMQRQYESLDEQYKRSYDKEESDAILEAKDKLEPEQKALAKRIKALQRKVGPEGARPTTPKGQMGLFDEPAESVAEIKQEPSTIVDEPYLRRLGIKPHIAVAKRILGKDLSNPAEAAIVGQNLDEHTQNTKSDVVRKSILEELQRPEFQGAPDGQTISDEASTKPIVGPTDGGVSVSEESITPTPSSVEAPNIPGVVGGTGPARVSNVGKGTYPGTLGTDIIAAVDAGEKAKVAEEEAKANRRSGVGEKTAIDPNAVVNTIKEGKEPPGAKYVQTPEDKAEIAEYSRNVTGHPEQMLSTYHESAGSISRGLNFLAGDIGLGLNPKVAKAAYKALTPDQQADVTAQASKIKAASKRGDRYLHDFNLSQGTRKQYEARLKEDLADLKTARDEAKATREARDKAEAEAKEEAAQVKETPAEKRARVAFETGAPQEAPAKKAPAGKRVGAKKTAVPEQPWSQPDSRTPKSKEEKEAQELAGEENPDEYEYTSKGAKLPPGVNFSEDASALTNPNTEKSLRNFIEGLFRSSERMYKVVKVYATQADAVLDNPNIKLSEAKGRVAGFTTSDGRVGLIAAHIAKGDELGTILHEIGVHLGMKKLIGAANMEWLQGKVRTWAKLGDGSVENLAAKEAVSRAKSSSSANKEEELIAYMVEELINRGVNPTAFATTNVGQWFRRYIAAMKVALRKLGFKREDLSGQNLIDLAYGAAELEMSDATGWHGTAAGFRKFDHAYMSSGEGAQAFGWGTYLAQREGIAKDYWRQDMTRKVLGQSDLGSIMTVPKRAAALEKFADYMKANAEKIGAYFERSVSKGVIKLPEIRSLYGMYAAHKYNNSDYEALLHEVINEITHAYLHSTQNVSGVASDVGVFLAVEAVMGRAKAEAARLSEKGGVKGSLMRVTANVQPDEMLDWDKPLSEQSEKVKAALEKLSAELEKADVLDDYLDKANAEWAELTGEELYKKILERAHRDDVDAISSFDPGDFGDYKEAASKYLDSIGIKGIRFLDQPSRSSAPSTPTTYNLVIFNDKNLVRVKTHPGADKETVQFSQTLTAAGEKAKKLVEDMKGISNEKPKKPHMGTIQKVGAFFMDPSYRVGLERAFRVQVVSKTASVEDKFRTLFNGAIRDSLGEVRPDLFAYQAEHSDNIAVQVMKFGKLVLTKGLGWEAKEGKASLQGVIDRVKNLGVKLGNQELAFKLANDAFIAKRANDVRGKGIIDEALIPDAAKTAAGLKAFKEFPELEEAFKEWTDYKNGLVDAMVDGGRITPQQAKVWKEGISYVPWNRLKDYEEQAANSPQGHFKGLVNLRGLKPLKGGEEEINNIFDNMVGLSFWMTNSAMRNHAALKITDAFLANDLGVRKVRQDQSGVDPNKVVTIYRDGIPESYEYEDPLDVYAFKGIESLGGPFLTAFTKMSNFLRKATTATPQFAISQLFQDSYRAVAFSGVNNPFSVPAKVIRGFIKEAGDDPLTKKINMLGIAGAVDLMPGRAQESIEKAFGIKQYTTMDKILSKMESFSIASDTALRKAVFQQTLDETKSKEFPEGDVLLARFRAQEIINFKRQGASKVVGVLRQMVPFMNAYIQGMDVLYRTMTGRGIAAKERQVAFGMFLQAGTKLAAMSTIYAMLVSGDDEYEGLRDYDKNKHFIFPGTGMKMPVAPEVGLLFKVIPERLYGYLISQSTDRPKDATELRKAIANAAFDALSGPNLTPQAVKPILEVYMNHSFFTNAPVVGRGMEYMAPNMQFTDATAELAKLLSNTAEQAGVELSPMKLEYLFRGFTGIAGGALLDISNSMFGDRPDKRLYEQPFAKTFMYDKVPGGYKEGYYAFRESINEVTTTVNALKAAGRADELVDYLEGDQKLTLYALRSTINKVDDQLGDIRKFKKIIAADPNMSGKDKKDAIEELEEAENDMVKAYNIPYLRKRIAGM